MKKLILFITIVLLFTGISFSQKVNMKVDEKIVANEQTDKKGNETGFFFYTQNDQTLKYMQMFNTLNGIDACSENIEIARKHRSGALAMLVIGVATFPIGFIILVNPINKKRKKEFIYVNLAVEDYNESLE